MDYRRGDGDFLGAVFFPLLAVDLITGDSVGGDTCDWQPENCGDEQERRQPGCESRLHLYRVWHSLCGGTIGVLWRPAGGRSAAPSCLGVLFEAGAR